MPEGRPFPHKHIPRLFQDLGITFGEPLSSESLKLAMIACAAGSSSSSSCAGADEKVAGWIKEEVEQTQGKVNLDVDRFRSEVTAMVQRKVEELGGTVLSDADADK